MAPGAFVQLAENKEDGKTGERTMLEASRQEIKDDILEKTQGTLGLESPALACWTYYIYDTIATGFRFVHLVVIFLPVILTAPTIWLGKRIKDRDGTRTGTLWWYRFLVRAMERAGPAFIKVSFARYIFFNRSWTNSFHSSDNGPRRALIYSPRKCAAPCPLFTRMLLRILCMRPSGQSAKLSTECLLKISLRNSTRSR
jgi:hypothetical protein